jgi:hypothetical protein
MDDRFLNGRGDGLVNLINVVSCWATSYGLDQLQLVPLGGSTGHRRDQPPHSDFLFYLRDLHNQDFNMRELVS